MIHGCYSKKTLGSKNMHSTIASCCPPLWIGWCVFQIEFHSAFFPCFKNIMWDFFGDSNIVTSNQVTNQIHWENGGGPLGMVPWIVQPIHSLYSGDLWIFIGYYIIPFQIGFLGGSTARVPSQGYHHFPYDIEVVEPLICDQDRKLP